MSKMKSNCLGYFVKFLKFYETKSKCFLFKSSLLSPKIIYNIGITLLLIFGKNVEYLFFFYLSMIIFSFIT